MARWVPDFFASGEWRPRPSVKTLANAMDGGAPSNMERIFDLYPDRERLRAEVVSLGVSDDEIVDVIREGVERYGRVWDPHTATATAAARALGSDRPIVTLSTAHPAKFPDAVEGATGVHPSLPPHMSDLFDRTERICSMPNDLAQVQAFVRSISRVVA